MNNQLEIDFVKLLRILMLANLVLSATMSFAGMRPPVDRETPPPVVNPPPVDSESEPFSYRNMFFYLEGKGGKIFNYGLHGTYLFSEDLFIDVLMAVQSREGVCYFGIYKNAEHKGFVRATTGFQCILPDDGGSGGSAGTGNLNQLKIMMGSLNVLSSITDFPTEISIEYKD